MTQTTLWLLPLVLSAIFGTVNSLRMGGFRWSWGTIIQHTVVLIIALCGLYVVPKLDWLCAYLGWGFMLSYTVIARIILGKMTKALGLLRCDQAIRNAHILRIIMSGPPGQFWLDLAILINFYLKGDVKSANSIYKKWQDFGLSKSISDSLTAYAMIGLLVMRDWNSVIEKYKETLGRYESGAAAGKKDTKFPFQIAMPALRAFHELGRYKEARQALVLADLPSTGYNRESTETMFLSFFAMLGAEHDLNDLLSQMSQTKSGLPEYAKLYWQARCAAERNDYEFAVLKFGESLRKTPEKDLAWRERTQQQIKHNQEKIQRTEAGTTTSIEEDNEKAESARVGRQIMERCFAISEILNSRKQPQAVYMLTGLISVMFVYSYYPFLLKEKTSFAFTYGILANNLVMAGQWWRLITYMFLHSGASHLMMNIFGLLWFGRLSENIYGSGRFLVIFFGSGIFSGALQMIMSAPDDQVVGASGAILGIFGAGLAAMLRLKNILPEQIRRQELSWMLVLAVTQLVFDQVANFLFPASDSLHASVRIAAAAHFGGMVSGFALGWMLPMRRMDLPIRQVDIAD